MGCMLHECAKCKAEWSDNESPNNITCPECKNQEANTIASWSDEAPGVWWNSNFEKMAEVPYA